MGGTRASGVLAGGVLAGGVLASGVPASGVPTLQLALVKMSTASPWASKSGPVAVWAEAALHVQPLQPLHAQPVLLAHSDIQPPPAGARKSAGAPGAPCAAHSRRGRVGAQLGTRAHPLSSAGGSTNIAGSAQDCAVRQAKRQRSWASSCPANPSCHTSRSAALGRPACAPHLGLQGMMGVIKPWKLMQRHR